EMNLAIQQLAEGVGENMRRRADKSLHHQRRRLDLWEFDHVPASPEGKQSIAKGRSFGRPTRSSERAKILRRVEILQYAGVVAGELEAIGGGMDHGTCPLIRGRLSERGEAIGGEEGRMAAAFPVDGYHQGMSRQGLYHLSQGLGPYPWRVHGGQEEGIHFARGKRVQTAVDGGELAAGRVGVDHDPREAQLHSAEDVRGCASQDHQDWCSAHADEPVQEDLKKSS